MKIAIIGAGITGLYLAWKLSKKGQEVTVFEKRAEIGKEVCSGLFSERIFQFLPESQSLVQNKINSVFINFPRKKVRVNFSRPFYVMSHAKLDRLAAGIARSAGVDIKLNTAINELPSWFDRIIGCDGANSAVRKAINIGNPDFRQGIQAFVKEEDKSNFVEAWPTKNGFIWKIPRGNEIEYGIMEKAFAARNIFEDFLAKKGISLREIKAWLIPHGFLVPRNPSITLCGDAAGLTKPWSGGGVIWGLIAADMLLKNFPDFIAYHKEVKRFFLPKIILGRSVTKFVNFWGHNFPYLMPSKITIESDFLI